ncbi:hypothetical protein [Streptomyces cyaneofuscatus]|uniref:hypothetical protein n=1 Tax=Streptomyces cyaneofuscatus TaxID=66883 RepID=UPI0036DC9124
MPATKTFTAESLITKYAADIAFVAGEQPASTVDDFTGQLRTAAHRIETARILGHEELEDAATFLDRADSNTTGSAALLAEAAESLVFVGDMASEYRNTV